MKKPTLNTQEPPEGETPSGILSTNPSFPWIVPEAAAYLDEILTQDMIGIEFGAGISTAWFCEKLKYLHTFECNFKWATAVILKIANNPKINHKWSLHYSNCDWNKDSTGRRWYIKNGHDKRPLKELEAMEKHFLSFNITEKIDFCFVDGSIRYDTFVKSLEILSDNPGAILCIDNTEKPHRKAYVDTLVPPWWEKHVFVSKPGATDYVEDNSETIIWIVK